MGLQSVLVRPARVPGLGGHSDHGGAECACERRRNWRCGALSKEADASRRGERARADAATARAAALGLDDADLRTAAIIVDGYAAETGLPRQATDAAAVNREAGAVAAGFVGQAAAQLQTLIRRLAARHSGLFTRLWYETLLLVVLAALVYRFGKNFIYDSWLAPELGLADAPQPVLGVDFFIAAGLCLVLWCGLLLWLFTSRLRRGLSAEVNQLVESWNSPKLVAGFFAGLERECRAIHAFRGELERLENRVQDLKTRLAQPEVLGHRVA